MTLSYKSYLFLTVFHVLVLLENLVLLWRYGATRCSYELSLLLIGWCAAHGLTCYAKYRHERRMQRLVDNLLKYAEKES
jgi:hypothetical protein